jgi:hypothetical protein
MKNPTAAYQTFDTNGDNTIPKILPGMKFRIFMKPEKRQ